MLTMLSKIVPIVINNESNILVLMVEGFTHPSYIMWYHLYITVINEPILALHQDISSYFVTCLLSKIKFCPWRCFSAVVLETGLQYNNCLHDTILLYYLWLKWFCPDTSSHLTKLSPIMRLKYLTYHIYNLIV